MILRKHPLIKVLPEVEKLARVLLFDLEPIWKSVPRSRCFCARKADNKMLVCEECDEWYHFDCVGLSDEQANAVDHWKCGYCSGEPDEEGQRRWILPIPQGGRKKAKTAPVRSDVNTPRALGIAVEGDEDLPTGPCTWAAVEAEVADLGQKINLKEKALKRQADAVIKAGGHHLVDEIVPGGTQARVADDGIVDELLANGMIDEDEQDDD